MRGFILLISSLISLAAWSDEYDFLTRNLLRIEDGKVTLGEFGRTPEISFERIRQINPQNYSQFLNSLNNLTPGLFNSYVLVHSSGSLQHSTQTHPRVLLFGENLIIGLRENPSTEDREVEIIEFDNQSFEFSTAEIKFPAGGVPEFRKNPQECIACHGQPTRPLWEAYDFWPSAFGSRAGFMGKAETEAFKSVATQSGILSYLKLSPDKITENIDGLTLYLSEMQFLNWVKRAEPRLREFSELRYGLLGLLSCAGNTYASAQQNFYQSLWPKEVESQLSNPISKIRESLSSQYKANNDYLARLYERIFGEKSTTTGLPIGRLFEQDVLPLAQLEGLLSLVGVSLKNATLSTQPQSISLATPTSWDFDLQRVLLYFFPEWNEPGLLWVENLIGSEMRIFKTDCQDIAQKSTAALSNFQRPEHLEDPTAFLVRPAFRMCVQCHSAKSDLDAPYIPFERTGQLSLWLRQDNGKNLRKVLGRLQAEGDKRMPKNTEITAEEKAALVSAFEALAKH